MCDWTAKSFQNFHSEVETNMPEGQARGNALFRIDSSLNPAQSLAAEQEIEAKWQTLRDHPSMPEASEAERARQLRLVGCNARGAPYVVMAIARTLDPGSISATFAHRFTERPPQPAALAAAFLEPACQGARGISSDTAAILATLAQSARLTPPSP